MDTKSAIKINFTLPLHITATVRRNVSGIKLIFMSQIIGVSFNPANQLLPDEKTELKILEKYHVSYTNVLAIQPGEAI